MELERADRSSAGRRQPHNGQVDDGGQHARRHLDRSDRHIKAQWTHAVKRIAMRSTCEWRKAAGHRFRAYGKENWAFDVGGEMAVRHASINDLPIQKAQRLVHWPQERWPDAHPRLHVLGR